MKRKLGLYGGMSVLLLVGASCSSVSPEQAMANSQSRFQDETKGYPDRARGQQNDKEARAQLDAMLNKKR
jgi:hypothetical protein